jgi:hypothetical protein
MDAMLWMMLPMFTAAGSALLAFYIMQARMEVAIAKEREALVEARAKLLGMEREVDVRVKAAEEETRRRSFDDFLSDFRVEERHYTRESKSLFLKKKSMVLQERLFFRNIPLSNWVEHELTVEEGTDARNLARAASIFSTRGVGSGGGSDEEQSSPPKASPVIPGLHPGRVPTPARMIA